MDTAVHAVAVLFIIAITFLVLTLVNGVQNEENTYRSMGSNRNRVVFVGVGVPVMGRTIDYPIRNTRKYPGDHDETGTTGDGLNF